VSLRSEELDPRKNQYRAIQISTKVVIQASGNAPTHGYRVWLERLPITASPPILTLCWEPPRGSLPAQETPFVVYATFDSPQKLRVVEVIDIGGRYTITVEQREEAMFS
jgi:hypothetical protein